MIKGLDRYLTTPPEDPELSPQSEAVMEIILTARGGWTWDGGSTRFFKQLQMLPEPTSSDNGRDFAVLQQWWTGKAIRCDRFDPFGLRCPIARIVSLACAVCVFREPEIRCRSRMLIGLLEIRETG